MPKQKTLPLTLQEKIRSLLELPILYSDTFPLPDDDNSYWIHIAQERIDGLAQGTLQATPIETLTYLLSLDKAGKLPDDWRPLLTHLRHRYTEPDLIPFLGGVLAVQGVTRLTADQQATLKELRDQLRLRQDSRLQEARAATRRRIDEMLGGKPK